MNEIALNYASALFSLAQEENQVNAWLEQSKLLLDIIKDNDDLIVLLDSHFLSSEERKAQAEKIFKDFSIEIVNFLKVIIDYHRLPLLYEIFQAFISLCNQSLGIKEGYLYSAFPLDKILVTQIEQKIGSYENSAVSLITRLDPNLIGGIKIAIGGHVYDDSVKNQLEKLQVNLLTKEKNHEN